MLNTMLIAFRRTTMSALYWWLGTLGIRWWEKINLEKTWRASIYNPSRTWPCLARRESRQSRTMSSTLLSDSLITRLMQGGSSSYVKRLRNEEKIPQEHRARTSLSLPLSFELRWWGWWQLHTLQRARKHRRYNGYTLTRIEMSPIVQKYHKKYTNAMGWIVFAIKSDNFNDAHL